MNQSLPRRDVHISHHRSDSPSYKFREYELTNIVKARNLWISGDSLRGDFVSEGRVLLDRGFTNDALSRLGLLNPGERIVLRSFIWRVSVEVRVVTVLSAKTLLLDRDIGHMRFHALKRRWRAQQRAPVEEPEEPEATGDTLKFAKIFEQFFGMQMAEFEKILGENNLLDQIQLSIDFSSPGSVMNSMRQLLSGEIPKPPQPEPERPKAETTKESESDTKESQAYQQLKKKLEPSKAKSLLSILGRKYSPKTHSAQYHFDLGEDCFTKYALDLFHNAYVLVLLKAENRVLIDAILPVLHRPFSSTKAVTREPYFKINEELVGEFKVEQMHRVIQVGWRYSIRACQCDLFFEDFGFDLRNCPVSVARNYRRKAYGLGVILNRRFYILFAPFRLEDYLKINGLNNFNPKIGRKRVFLIFHRSGHDGFFFQSRSINLRLGIEKPPQVQIARQNSEWEQKHLRTHLAQKKREILGADGLPVRLQNVHMRTFDVHHSIAFGQLHRQQNEDIRQMNEHWEALHKRVSASESEPAPGPSREFELRSLISPKSATGQFLEHVLSKSLLFLSKLTDEHRLVVLQTSTSQESLTHSFNLVFTDSSRDELPGHSQLMVHYRRNNSFRVRVKDRVYDLGLSPSQAHYFFAFVQEFFVIGVFDRFLPEDQLQIQFIFRDALFERIDEVYMDQFFTENLIISDFQVLPVFGFSRRLLSELRTRRLARSLKSVSARVNCQKRLLLETGSPCKFDRERRNHAILHFECSHFFYRIQSKFVAGCGEGLTGRWVPLSLFCQVLFVLHPGAIGRASA